MGDLLVEIPLAQQHYKKDTEGILFFNSQQTFWYISMFCGKGWKWTKETYLLCWVQYERTEGSKQHADPWARDHIVTPTVISPVAGLIKTHSLLLNQLRPIIKQLCSQSLLKVFSYKLYYFMGNLIYHFTLSQCKERSITMSPKRAK